MKEYADRIGADYVFEENPKWERAARIPGKWSRYYGCFKPVFDDHYHEYDNVLFADTDVFPVDGLEENIFETFTGELGMCTEPLQPEYRVIKGLAEKDKAWARIVEHKYGSKPPKDAKGRYKVYNSGVVLYSNAGLVKCKESFPSFNEYVTLMQGVAGVHQTDQGYLHAMAFAMDIDFQELDNEWNRYIVYDPKVKPVMNTRKVCDPRTPNTKMVHVQLAGSDHQSNKWHYNVVNKPVTTWGSNFKGEILV
jgi:hypothetical protein